MMYIQNRYAHDTDFCFILEKIIRYIDVKTKTDFTGN